MASKKGRSGVGTAELAGVTASDVQRGGRGKMAIRPRRVPARTCIACRQVEGKRSLIRVVRTVTGGVEVDLTGRKNGRGAYLHADQACWDLALKRNTFNMALKTTVGGEDLQAIRAYRDGLRPTEVTLAEAPATPVSEPRSQEEQANAG